MTANPDRWPELSYAAWRDTRDTLHLWTQVVGKIRLALTPWLNHSWHVALYVTARGLTTSPMPYQGGSLAIDFDFIDHVLWLRLSNGHFRQVELKPVSVAEFYADVLIALKELGVAVPIRAMPCEISDCMPFDEDTMHKSYDADYANRFWRALLAAHEVLGRFRTGFVGKASPVHFFWGSFDLAVTRFSGRRAPRHPGGVPHLPNAVAQEAYSHEVSSAGFWPGSPGPVEYAAFYSYAYPAPEGFAAAEGEARGGILLQGIGRIHSALRRRAHRARSGRRADGIPAKHVRRRGRSGEMGPRGAGVRAGRGGQVQGDVERLRFACTRLDTFNDQTAKRARAIARILCGPG